MIWIAPSERDTGTETLKSCLWAAADQLRANSDLTSAQYSQPVLGLIFLRFAEVCSSRNGPRWRSRRLGDVAALASMTRSRIRRPCSGIVLAPALSERGWLCAMEGC